MMEEHFDRIDAHFDRIDKPFDHVDSGLDDLRRYMDALHAELVRCIAETSKEPLATRADVQAVVAKIDELVGGRVVPLELVVRGLVQKQGGGV